MTEREIFLASFNRPRDYFELPLKSQWEIDRQLGILDWKGEDLSEEDLKRFKAHYYIDQRKENLKPCIKTLLTPSMR